MFKPLALAVAFATTLTLFGTSSPTSAQPAAQAITSAPAQTSQAVPNSLIQNVHYKRRCFRRKVRVCFARYYGNCAKWGWRKVRVCRGIKHTHYRKKKKIYSYSY